MLLPVLIHANFNIWILVEIKMDALKFIILLIDQFFYIILINNK